MSLESLCNQHQVTIHAEIDTTGTSGGGAITYGPGRTIRCRVVPMSLMEQARYAKVNLEATHKLYFISDPGVNDGDKIVFGSRVMHVIGKCNPDELGKFWRVHASEKLHRAETA